LALTYISPDNVTPRRRLITHAHARAAARDPRDKIAPVRAARGAFYYGATAGNNRVFRSSREPHPGIYGTIVFTIEADLRACALLSELQLFSSTRSLAHLFARTEYMFVK